MGTRVGDRLAALDAVIKGSRVALVEARQTNSAAAPWNLLRPVSVEHQACSIASEATMNGLIYLVGLVVVIMFILSFLGLR